jgi:hypothetical protein
MSLIFADRVKETTTTVGTGAITLGGAVAGYISFSACMSTADTCYYCITNGTQWETGLGTYAVPGGNPTLQRTTILESSLLNTAVNFTAGSKDVFITAPASLFDSYPKKIQEITFAGAENNVTKTLNIAINEQSAYDIYIKTSTLSVGANYLISFVNTMCDTKKTIITGAVLASTDTIDYNIPLGTLNNGGLYMNISIRGFNVTASGYAYHYSPAAVNQIIINSRIRLADTQIGLYGSFSATSLVKIIGWGI